MGEIKPTINDRVIYNGITYLIESVIHIGKPNKDDDNMRYWLINTNDLNDGFWCNKSFIENNTTQATTYQTTIFDYMKP